MYHWVQRPFCHFLKVISGRAEEHGKTPGVFMITSMTDFFSLQVSTDTHYVMFSPSGTTDSSSVFKKFYCFALGKWKSFEDFIGKFSFGYSTLKPSYQTVATSILHWQLEVKMKQALKTSLWEWKKKIVQGLRMKNSTLSSCLCLQNKY